MNQKRRDIKISGAVRDLHHLRLMALLLELVRLRGISGTARVLEIDPRTVTASVKSGQLTRRVRDSLQRALQHGIGSAADRQRERSDKLEARLDKMENQLKELKENLRSGLKVLDKLGARLDKTEGRLKELREHLPRGLKRLRMSLDGVRKYYGVQRRLIEQRLLALETVREGTETRADAAGESRVPESSSVAASAVHPRQLPDATPAESPDAEGRLSSPLEWAVAHAADGASLADAPAAPEVPR